MSDGKTIMIQKENTTSAMSEKNTAYVALGSNLEAPYQNLQHAIDRLSEEFDEVIASDIFRSEADGLVDGGGDFANAVARLRTDMPPFSLLDKLQAMEIEAGRAAGHERGVSRHLDLDIISYGDLKMSSDRLTIPHSRAHLRLFVLLPLQQIAPSISLNGRSLPELIRLAPVMRIERW